jgi:hypothetical protein
MSLETSSIGAEAEHGLVAGEQDLERVVVVGQLAG